MTDKGMLFHFRLLHDINRKLRRRVYRKGELVQLIVLIIKTIDLTNVPLVEINRELRSSSQSTIELPTALHEKLKKAALKRKASMNVLLNSAVRAYTIAHPEEEDPD